jgi:hypothetical protein
MISAKERDKTKMTKAGKPCKLQIELCNFFGRSLAETDSPIIVEKLLFAIFSRYLTTVKKTVATKRKAPNKSKGTEADVEEVDVSISETVTIKLASSSYTRSCSALSYLFTESGISKDFNDTTRELWLKLSAYNKGMRRVGGKEKRNLGISTEEGKRPLPFAAYKYLAKVLFESDKAEHFGAHTFLIIAWNYISRA